MKRTIALYSLFFCVWLTAAARADLVLEKVSEIGGISTCVHGANSMLVFNEGKNLVFYSIDAPGAFSPVNRISLVDMVTDVVIKNGFCYALTDDAGLYAIDIRDPHNMQITDIVQGIANGRDLQIVKDALLVSDSSGVQIIQCYNPADPEWLESIHLNAGALATAYDPVNSQLYVLEDGYGVRIYNFVFLNQPREDGSYAIPGYLGGTGKLAVKQTYLYITDPYSNQLRVLNVANPQSVQAVTNFGPAKTTPFDIQISANRAYLSVLSGGVYVLDITYPLQLKYLTFIATGASPRELAVLGDFLCATDIADNLVIMNLQNLQAVQKIATFHSWIPMAKNVAVDQQKLFVTSMSGGVQMLDVFDPLHPGFLGSYRHHGLNAQAVVAENEILYLADDDSVHIINTADPSLPRRSGSFFTGAAQSNSYIVAMNKWNEQLFLACGAAGLKFADVRNPATARITSTYDTPALCRDLFVWQDYLVYADFISTQLVRYADPANVQLISQDANRLSYCVCRENDYVLVGSDNLYLYKLDAANQMTFVSESRDRFPCTKIVALEGYAFAGGELGICAFDLRDPYNVKAASSVYRTKEPVSDLVIKNGYIYAALGQEGLVILSIKVDQPATPPTVVINTQDDGPGSLRAALEYANSHKGMDAILFAIPKTDPGFDAQLGVWRIQPSTPFPHITDDSLAIAGSSQRQFLSEDANPFGPEIVIDGAATAAYAGSGFYAQGVQQIYLTGLNICNFSSAGINFINVEQAQISGCYIGTDPVGMKAAGNSPGIQIWQGCRNIQVVSVLGDTNIVSGNDYAGIAIMQDSKQIALVGNIIGLNRTGQATLGNKSFGGIRITSQSDSNFVYRNRIGGNPMGIEISESSNNAIFDNVIGTDSTLIKNLGNSLYGISIRGQDKPAMQNMLMNNIIGFNGQTGVYISGAKAIENTIANNIFYRNNDRGIENVDGGNKELAPPDLYDIDQNKILHGKGEPEQFIQVFTDDGREGQRLLSSEQCDASGNFSVDLKGLSLLKNITALAMDANGNTSEFSVMLVTLVEHDGTSAPMEFYLQQNYPNPFNPTTFIGFGVKKACRVRLRVYDVLGRCVLQLADRRYEPGHYRVPCEAKSWSSGVYFCTIEMEEFQATRKMILMR